MLSGRSERTRWRYCRGSWSKRPHSKTATPKTATTFLATKTATTKTATLYWSKRPHREDHYQNGQTAFGQNGHTGRITTKTATLHLVKTATKGGSLQKRPHCIWSKRPQREDHYQNGHTAFGQNGHTGRGSLDLLPVISHARGCACSHAAGPVSNIFHRNSDFILTCYDRYTSLTASKYFVVLLSPMLVLHVFWLYILYTLCICVYIALYIFALLPVVY